MSQADFIVNTARRLTEKLAKSPWYKCDGEYPKPVQVEIERMIKHCKGVKDERIPKS